MSPLVRALRATHATLLAGVTNNWRYVGLLSLVLAPLSEVAFRFFDPKAGNPTDYWNAHYYLFSAGPHISGLLVATGFYFLLHEKVRNWALLPAAYRFANILWLAYVSSNEEFHQFVPLAFIGLGLCSAVLWFMSFDFLMSLHFHKREGIIARLVGIINAPGISDHDKVEVAKNEASNLKHFA